MKRVAILLPLVLLAGCSGQAVNKNAQTTFLNSDDMVAMTDKMAASIMGDPEILQAVQAQNGPLKIVIKPVENDTNEIITDNRKELFVARLRALLSSKPQLRDRFVWVINKSDYDKLRAEELPADQISENEYRVVPEYALYATFLADTNVSRKQRGDTYLCDYKLTRLTGPQAGVELWADHFETSKHIKKSILD